MAGTMVYVAQLRRLFRAPTEARRNPSVLLKAITMTEALHFEDIGMGESRRLAETHGTRTLGEVEAQDALKSLHAVHGTLEALARLEKEEADVQMMELDFSELNLGNAGEPNVLRRRAPQRILMHKDDLPQTSLTISDMMHRIEAQKRDLCSWRLKPTQATALYLLPVPAVLLGLPVLPESCLPDLVCSCCSRKLFFEIGASTVSQPNAPGSTLEFVHYMNAIRVYASVADEEPRVPALPLEVASLIANVPEHIEEVDYDIVANMYSAFSIAICPSATKKGVRCDESFNQARSCECNSNFAFATEEHVSLSNRRHWARKTLDEMFE